MSGAGRTIGVFDSGVGGLTVLHAIHRLLPDRDTAYLGDTARVPYGTRSAETVVRYALNAARFLSAREDLGVLVVACNTASAVAIDALSRALPIPVIGVIEPTAERAVAVSKNGRIGVVGTRGTIASGAYQRAIAALRPGAATFAEACPLFVPLAEEGWTDTSDAVARAIAERYLAPLTAHGIDTLILGCTHYPLLAGVIRAVIGPSVILADAADSVAEALAASETLPPSRNGQPLRRYYVTDLPKGFTRVAERFLGGPIDPPIEVDL
ncbi:MAG: glutamate racemase [Deltaproteobacteria bacterium]|nr:glutamate racemase [Deltaproteobacteria bacterium]